MVSARIAAAVNKRFHSYQKGIQVGMAKAHTDGWIELAVHPRYKENLERYMQVVRSVAIQETSAERMQRIVDLEKKLFVPETAAQAAVQLEAIGTEGVDTLLKGLKSKQSDVQIYAAEALAYLGRREAAPPLGLAARNQPAQRVRALTALASMDDPAAVDQLRELLNVPSAETRYGAFRAFWIASPNDPLMRGKQLGGQFSYHVLDTPDPPMVHVTRSHRAEVVLFGRDQRFTTPLAVNAGNQIMITNTTPDEISVSKFAVGDADQKRTVSTRVDDVIQAVVELGGTYPDVVQALQEAKAAGALPSRFEVEAVPGSIYEPVVQKNAEEKSSPSDNGQAAGNASTGNAKG